MWHGGVIAVIFFGANIIQSVASAQGARIMARMRTRMYSYLSMEIIRKTVHLSALGQKQVGSTGSLFQVFAQDCQRLAQMLPMIFRSFDTLLTTIGAFVYLGVLVDWPTCGAAFVFCLVIPFNYRISDSFIGYFIQKMIKGDARANKVIEIINSVRVIKFYAWERPFRALVDTLRKPELEIISQLMKQLAYLMCSFSLATPLIQLVLFILIAVRSGNQMSALIFFQSLSLINIVSFTLIRLPFLYSMYLQVLVSLARVDKVLAAHEKGSSDSKELKELESSLNVGDVRVRGSFQWPDPDTAAGIKATQLRETQMVELEGKIGRGFQSPKDLLRITKELEELKTKNTEESAKPQKRIVAVPNVHFDANSGEMVVIVGKVGSGKSSLISSIIGEMAPGTTEDGQEATALSAHRGTIAYVPQTPWILNATIRNNIIVNRPFDAVKYEAVLRAVDFTIDLAALPNSDLTEVGEKGINLSGGQRQRVSIARALYQEADIYLFDDPLSALDAQVSRHVFTHIMTMLPGKTKILVTHHLSYLSEAQRVYLMHDMTLTEESVPDVVHDLPQEGESSLVVMMRAWKTSSTVEAAASPKAASPSNKQAETEGTKKKSKSSGQLTIKEERLAGTVKTSTLFHYLRSYGGFWFWFTVLSLNLLAISCNIFSQLWMAFWTERRWPKFSAEHSVEFFLGIYAAALISSAFIVLIRELVWREGAVNAPRVLYDKMMASVLAAPMSFYDTTPTGRIINRFTRDSEMLDFTVPMAANQVMSLFFVQLGSLISISVIMPYFAPVAFACIVIIPFLQPTVATVVLRRLSSATNSPVMALFGEVVSGSVSIRSQNFTEFFMLRFASLLDVANAAAYTDGLLFEAVRTRVNIVMALVSTAVMLIVMASRGELQPATASFVISQSLQLTLFMGHFMMMRGNLMLALNSIERLLEYCEIKPEKNGDLVPPENWPETGTIEFQDVSAQYRPHLPLVLHHLSLTIKSGEKIGICGRTGSGKSSLLLSLFRMIPFSKNSSIKIDGVDTSSMSLECLRSKMSAIPQEPVLFAGTIRSNLDPFATVQDEKLLNAIRLCHLEEPLRKLLEKPTATKPGGHPQEESTAAAVDKVKTEDATAILNVTVGDSDLSVGQKQLLCLARAISRDMKVLVLDEATSSVDVHTDQLIQKTIRTVFKDCTVLTVAHRINTILDSDRILVLKDGTVTEFDTPTALLDNPDSIFAHLVEESNRSHNE